MKETCDKILPMISEMRDWRLRIQREILNENHLYIAESYSEVANFYEKQKNYERAKFLYDNALRIRRKLIGENHLDTANSYRNLGRICSKLDEDEKAEFLYENSIKIQERLLGENNFDIANDCAKLAWICIYQEKYEKALCNLIKAYKILFKIRDQDIQCFYRYVYEFMEYTYSKWNPEGNFKQWLKENMEKEQISSS